MSILIDTKTDSILKMAFHETTNDHEAGNAYTKGRAALRARNLSLADVGLIYPVPSSVLQTRQMEAELQASRAREAKLMNLVTLQDSKIQEQATKLAEFSAAIGDLSRMHAQHATLMEHCTAMTARMQVIERDLLEAQVREARAIGGTFGIRKLRKAA